MDFGDWEVKSVMAGRFGLDGGAMFGVVPKALWAKSIEPDESNRIPMAMRVLLARGHGKTVLVDVGAGGGYSDKNSKIYAFEKHDDLCGALESAGVSPGDVTDVVITHLHFDHGAGISERDEEGEGWRLVFPQAAHHVHTTQYEHTFKPNPRDRASYFAERLETMARENVLELHDGPWTLSPGFDVLIFDGHTPGQQLPKITGGGETVFFCGDLIPTRHHIPTPYIMAYDLDPVLAMEEKTRLLERAYDENWVLFLEHDADIAACRLERENDRFKAGEVLAI